MLRRDLQTAPVHLFRCERVNFQTHLMDRVESAALQSSAIRSIDFAYQALRTNQHMQESPFLFSLKIVFSTWEHDKKIENPVCVNFDPLVDNEDGGWGTEGCEYGGLKDGFYICRCRHLSIFAVILSEKYDSSAFNFRLGTSVYVGCAVSIIGLSLTVLLYLLS
ncbi:hypothetical protein AVEN_20057-1, partial [Araneus ventricosus]